MGVHLHRHPDQVPQGPDSDLHNSQLFLLIFLLTHLQTLEQLFQIDHSLLVGPDQVRQSPQTEIQKLRAQEMCQEDIHHQLSQGEESQMPLERVVFIPMGMWLTCLSLEKFHTRQIWECGDLPSHHQLSQRVLGLEGHYQRSLWIWHSGIWYVQPLFLVTIYQL